MIQRQVNKLQNLMRSVSLNALLKRYQNAIERKKTEVFLNELANTSLGPALARCVLVDGMWDNPN